MTPPEKLKQIYERNERLYKDKLGPTPDRMHKDGKSWADIINSSCKPGGMDIIPLLLAQGLGDEKLEARIQAMRSGGSVPWFDIVSALVKELKKK